ncbi:hypothetical protein ACA910_007086 [Epithemia clementina (nom. ined.)]
MDATTHLYLEFLKNFSQLNFHLVLSQGQGHAFAVRGQGITGMHVHCGVAGKNGPMIAILYDLAMTALPTVD